MIKDIEKLSITWWQLLKYHLDLFLLEAKLAKLTVIPLITCTLIFVILNILMWSYLLIAIGYSLYLYFNNLFIAMSVPFILNLIALASAGIYSVRGLKRLRFPRTRASFKNYQTAKRNEKTPITPAN